VRQAAEEQDEARDDQSRDGYTLFRCRFDHVSWCGNAGWFPGYPWLIAVLHALGLASTWSAVVVAWFFRLATLVLMWGTFLERRRSTASVGALLLAAFAPGGIYGFAAFPLSLLAFATVACLWFLARGRWLAAGLAGAAAVLAYPLGIALVLVGALWPLVAPSGATLGRRLARSALVAGLTAAGLLVVALVERIQTGAWDAYVLVQDKYGHGLQVPVRSATHAVAELFDGWRVWPALQTLLVTVILVAALAWAVRNRGRLGQADLLVLLWAIPTWVLANLQTHVSLYRSEAALLPLALLARRLPTPFLYTLVALAALLTVAMTTLYVDSTLF